MITKRCPCCRGLGYVTIKDWPHPEERDKRQKLARRLRAQGLSLRQIARALGYKNHNSICRWVERQKGVRGPV